MARNDLPFSKTEIFKRCEYEPHSDAQREIHEANERFLTLTCGRRWGKSMAAGMDLVPYLFIPDSHWWIVGPNYSLGEKEFRVVHDAIFRKMKLGRGTNRAKYWYNTKQGDMKIEMPWNTLLEVKSAERPDSLVGEKLWGVVMSEAALHNFPTWPMFIQPALADTLGWATFPSTPRGFNWFAAMYDAGQDPNMKDYKSWRLPSWTNPHVYPGGRQDPEILRLEREVSKNFFLQEIAAEFTAFEGKIYNDFDPRIHVKDIPYNHEWKNFWAFDFGYVDPFICLDIMVDPADNVYVWREYQVSGLSTYEHARIMANRDNPKGFHVDWMAADPRGADEIATLNLILGQCYANSVAWKPGIEAISQHLKANKLFIDRSCVNLIRQMERLRFADSRDGRNAVEKQHDYDDHGPDALRYFFNEYFVLGVARGSLADIYKDRGYRTAAATMFQQSDRLTYQDQIGLR